MRLWVIPQKNALQPTMNSSNKELIEKICSEYRQHWNGSIRPSLAKFLQGVDREDEPDVVAALIAVDLEQFEKTGSRPSPDQYDSLSERASEIVCQKLEKAFPNEDLSHFRGNMSFESQSETILQDSEQDVESEDLDGTFQSHGAFANKEYHSEFAGRYKLIKQIGTGGMGAVWMADQQAPVRRRVALKFIRPELGSKNAVARFEAERQAIALMNHPNIAKILDAGETEEGNPYFVMELVSGVQLNKYCDENRLTIRERLELMIPVCSAVQHAHQKGIIHRDLKHSNVLVSDGDNGPVPKVIDFGLAKALERHFSLTDESMLTEVGNVVGTLNYMSPEQAGLANNDVDTRSDIYSLGVMIYKLLTGSTPMQEFTKSELSFAESLEKVRAQDSVRPSVWVNRNPDSINAVCDARNSDPESLSKLLSGDLDWIVTKALEKDRRERYQTANALSMEIQRYLNDEKVIARPPSVIYGMRKFVKRNKGLVGSFVAATVLLIAGILGTSMATVWALKERDRANERTEFARGETERAVMAQKTAEKSEAAKKIQLHSMLMKSAWSDWRLGNAESAWQTINKVNSEHEGWETSFLRTEFSSNEEVFYGHVRDVESVAYSNDGKFIVSGAGDDSIKVWNALSRQLARTLLTTDNVTCVAITPDSKTVISGDRSNQILFWDIETGEQMGQLGPYETDITCLAISKDGAQLLFGTAHLDTVRVNSDREDILPGQPVIRVVNIKDLAVVQELEGHQAEIVAVDICGNGEHLVSVDRNGFVKIWTNSIVDHADGFQRSTELAINGTISDIAISPDSNTFASSGSDKLIRVWSFDGELLEVFTGHKANITSVNFSNDGQRIVSTSEDKTARVWTRTGDELLVCNGHYAPVIDAVFSPDGNEIVTGSADDTLRVWNAFNSPSTIVVKAHKDVVWSADFTESGKLAASASEDGTVAILDVVNGKQVGDKLEHGQAVLSLQFSPNGKLLASAGADNTIHVWNPANGVLVTKLTGHSDFVWDVSFSPNGEFLASASSDKTAKIWRTSDWKLLNTISAHDSELGSVRYSNDGQRLVTASDDQTVKVWDANTFELLAVLEGHKHAVWRAVFSPTDELIASSGYSGEVLIWNADNYQLIHRCTEHSDQVAGIVFSKSGNRLVSASDDATIRIWDVNSGQELFVLRDKNNSPIVHCSFSDDGTKLVSGNAEGYVTIRTARDSNSKRDCLLPQEASKLIVDGLRILSSPDATEEDFGRQLKIANRVCRFIPSFDSLTNRGIAEYRTGSYEAAVTTLKEAERLEAIQYAQPDLRPNIEAFLAMSLFQLGELEEAQRYRKAFDEKRKIELWKEDKHVLFLEGEVGKVFESPSH